MKLSKNIFWVNGFYDRKYLRVCACYRLLKRGTIGKARALELLAKVHTSGEMNTLRATVEMWKAGPIKDMCP